MNVGPYSEDQILRTNKLQKLYLNLPTSKSKNTIISGHQSPNFSSIFANQKDKELSIGKIEVFNLKELVVHCADQMISLLEVQQEGKKRLSIQDFLKGSNIKNGDHFS